MYCNITSDQTSEHCPSLYNLYNKHSQLPTSNAVLCILPLTVQSAMPISMHTARIIKGPNRYCSTTSWQTCPMPNCWWLTRQCFTLATSTLSAIPCTVYIHSATHKPKNTLPTPLLGD